jgi:hypothetical protein
MKKVFLLAILAMVSIATFAQKEVSDTLDFNRIKEDGYLKSYKSNHQFAAMKMIDGSYVNAGDEIPLGKPSSNNTIAQKNVGLSSGSISAVSAFNFLTIGRVGLSVMSGMQYLPSSLSGRKVRIKEIKKGWTIFEFVDGGSVGTIMNVVDAFAMGEVINPNAAMTRDQAIAKLKEQKDLLDLGMITKEQFEKIKVDLTPIIMKVS